MRVDYTQIAGRSLERLAALSDGIFAVAMTLLALDLRLPALEIVHSAEAIWTPGALASEQPLLDALARLEPRLLTYLMAFLTLGIFWLGQQTQLSNLTHSDRNLSWLHIVFLMAVSLMPFSTGLLSDHITFRVALLIYSLNLFVLGLMLFITWRYSLRVGLVQKDISPEAIGAIERRILTYQSLYITATALCVINTYVSIVLIVLVQLNAAIGLVGRLRASK